MTNLTTVKLNIIKKNRVYFACKNDRGYEVKLRITETSKDLELGEHELLVEDASVKTKYGTDVIYILHSAIDQNEVIVLKSSKNNHLITRCKELGGKWDAEDKVWVFSNVVKSEVEELDFLYNSELVSIKLTALREISEHTNAVTFLGYDVAYATGRDSGGKTCEGVALIAGSINSSGSSKNWYTDVTEGTVLKLKVPVELLNLEISNEDFKVERI